MKLYPEKFVLEKKIASFIILDMDLSCVYQARKSLSPYIAKTPLVRCYELEKSLEIDNRIYLKCENLQRCNSFKARGAYNAILHLTPEEKKRGIITRSSGNFGQAIAMAGMEMQIPTIIILSAGIPEIKKQKIQQFGPEMFFCKTRQEEEEMVEKLSKERGFVALSPYNIEDVITGQGTAALEIIEQLPTVANIFSPVGGGGLMAGCGFVLKAHDEKIRTIAVEPEGAADFYLSMQAKEIKEWDNPQTIADGLRTPKVGSVPWKILQKTVDTAVTVSENSIKKAMALLYHKVGILLEPSGAVSVAGLMQHKKLGLKGDIVCLLSGGNVDRKMFYQWMQETENFL